MYSFSNRRGHHRKRLSALRLSSDSTVTTLPLYTSPSHVRHHDISEIPSDQPPAYPDSAEEADEDTDQSDSQSVLPYVPHTPPSLPVSPRRRRSQASTRGHRRQQSIANASDPYLDSLLERSVHALEMSNALLQSSISTQSSLSAVLADDAATDRHLEERAQMLTSRIRSNKGIQESWMADLDEISQRVEGLVRGDDTSDEESRAPPASISQSLPTSSLSERIHRRQDRRPSQNLQGHHTAASSSTSNLQLSVHDRSHFVSPPPRAFTMYIDSSEAADLITLPATLGVRPSARPPPTVLPTQAAPMVTSPESEPVLISSSSSENAKRVAEVLASYVMPRSSSLSSSPSRTQRRSSSSSASTVRKRRFSQSPPPAIAVETPARPPSKRSRSVTPTHGSPALRHTRPLTPPIEELSTSSTSSESTTLHVDRTVESLRQILQRQRSAEQLAGKNRPPSTKSVPPVPRPSLLSPPTVVPVSGTSNATASVSRLFTKSRHTTSTRAQSPPRQSSMKNRSAPSTPISAITPSPSPPLLNIPFGLGRSKSGTSSGASTPKRISFAEPAESYSSSKPAGSSSEFRATKTRSKSKSKLGGKERGRDQSKGKGKADSDDSDAERGGWWTGWLLGATGTQSGSGLSMGVGRARSEERYAYPNTRGATSGGTWSMRPGFGGNLEEWGA